MRGNLGSAQFENLRGYKSKAVMSLCKRLRPNRCLQASLAMLSIHIAATLKPRAATTIAPRGRGRPHAHSGALLLSDQRATARAARPEIGTVMTADSQVSQLQYQSTARGVPTAAAMSQLRSYESLSMSGIVDLQGGGHSKAGIRGSLTDESSTALNIMKKK